MPTEKREFFSMDIWTFIGILGMILILYAFLMIQLKKWNQDQFSYDFVNFLGSVLLVIYAVAFHAVPFMILNGVWALYSLRDVLVDLVGKSNKNKPG